MVLVKSSLLVRWLNSCKVFSGFSRLPCVQCLENRPQVIYQQYRFITHRPLIGNKDESSCDATNSRSTGLFIAGAIIAGYGLLKTITVNAAEPDTGELVISTELPAGLSPRQKFNFISEVVQKVAPAVVFIEIKSHLRSPNYHFNTPQTISNGSGFIIEENGLIVTNAHVVLGQPNCSVQVKLHDGRIFQGSIECIDTKSDLATIRIPCNGLPVLKMGSSSDVKAGEWVVAVGSPLSLANTITAGVVSSVNRGSMELGIQGKDMEYIQTDASITFGNSGGPLINLDGEVVGVNAMKVTAGISFAIPIDYVKDFLSSMKAQQLVSEKRGSKDTRKKFKRRYLGVTLLTLTPQIITELQMRGTELSPDVKNGVLVWKVVVGSSAHSGGIQPGDVIVAINEHPIESSQDLYRYLETEEAKLKLTIVRKREKMNFRISLEDI